jgi:hypothetical protein
MIKKIIKYISDIDGKEHEFCSKQKVVEFEENYRIEKEIEDYLPIFEKYFKTRFSKNPWKWSDQYKTFCVDCGKMVSQYEEEYNGYDSSYAGKELYSEPNKLFLDGFRCLKCHDKIIKLYENMNQLYNNNKKVILMSFDSLWHFSKLSLEHQLELIRIVKCWNNKWIVKKGKTKCQKTKLKN